MRVVTAKNMHIGSLFHQFRKETTGDLTLKSLAKKIGRSDVYIIQIEKGRTNPSDKVLTDILSKGFDLSKPQAIEKVKEWRISSILGHKNWQTESKSHITEEPNFFLIPLLGAISCGDFNSALETSDETYPVSANLVKKPSQYFCLTCKGISMSGIAEDGDVVLVNTKAEPHNGKICVFRIGDEATMGYFHQDNKGLIEIRKANKSYPPLRIHDDGFEIVGIIEYVMKKI